MSGKKPRLTPLELRKQLLVAESDVNRALLVEEAQIMAAELRQVVHKALSFKTMAASIIPLFAELAALTRGKSVPGTSRTTWFQRVVRGLRLAFTLWLLFRPRRPAPKENPS